MSINWTQKKTTTALIVHISCWSTLHYIIELRTRANVVYLYLRNVCVYVQSWLLSGNRQLRVIVVWIIYAAFASLVLFTMFTDLWLSCILLIMDSPCTFSVLHHLCWTRSIFISHVHVILVNASIDIQKKQVSHHFVHKVISLFWKLFHWHTGSKFAVKWSLKIKLHLTSVYSVWDMEIDFN